MAAPITEFVWEAASEEWDATAARVRRVLRRRGVDAHTAEDLVQEVALRILSGGVTFVDNVHRERWALRVAWNLAQNRWRDDRRLAYVEPPDASDIADVAHVIEQRESLGRVLAGFRDLAERDQEAIILGFEPAGQDGATVVRRHRARAKLARLRGVIGVGLGRLRDRMAAMFETVDEVVRQAIYAGILLAAPLGGAAIEWSLPGDTGAAAGTPARHTEFEVSASYSTAGPTNGRAAASTPRLTAPPAGPSTNPPDDSAARATVNAPTGDQAQIVVGGEPPPETHGQTSCTSLSAFWPDADDPAPGFCIPDNL